MSPLRAFLAAEAAQPVTEPVRAFAEALAAGTGAVAVLFYGSALRTGALDGVLDFYVLTDGPHRRGWRGAVERRLWPEVRFERCDTSAGVLHAKVAVMPLEVFARAAADGGRDTTVWTRFVQPCRLVHARDAADREAVEAALASAAVTAARFAAVLGPERGEARAYWSALFRATYAAELRVEPPGREAQVLDAAPARWDALLPLAWDAAHIGCRDDGNGLAPDVEGDGRAALRRAWASRRRWGKALNGARLIKAALTAPGAAAYAAGKLARHTDVAVTVTPWRERHPLLAAVPVLWPVLRRLRRRAPQPDAR